MNMSSGNNIKREIFFDSAYLEQRRRGCSWNWTRFRPRRSLELAELGDGVIVTVSRGKMSEDPAVMSSNAGRFSSSGGELKSMQRKRRFRQKTRPLHILTR